MEPQIKRGITRDEYTRTTHVVWRLYYLTSTTWQVHMTWTCDTRAETRWVAFTHQWIRIGGAAAGVPEREVGRLIVESKALA
jgi:hypothetical protein